LQPWQFTANFGINSSAHPRCSWLPSVSLVLRPMEADTIEKTLNVLERDFRSVALCQDLPRLAKCVDIDVDGKVMFSGAARKTSSSEDAVSELLFTVARWVDGVEAQEELEEAYRKYFASRDAGDAGSRCGSSFVLFLGPIFSVRHLARDIPAFPCHSSCYVALSLLPVFSFPQFVYVVVWCRTGPYVACREYLQPSYAGVFLSRFPFRRAGRFPR
jgi:hypothetical protein